MGQKVSPHGLRVGIIKDWSSKWYAGKGDFAKFIAQDNELRVFIKKKLYAAGVSKIVIERAEKLKLIISVGRPGMVIGKSGQGIDELKANIEKITKSPVEISIIEVKTTELDAQLSAQSIAEALERRVSFRRAMKQAMGRTMKANAKGIKVLVSGRLGGAEIARSEKYSEGNVPLHTLRADIDYGFAEADTTYGKIGVKVWIYHGEILDKGLQSVIRVEKQDKKNDRKNRRDGKRNNDSRGYDRKRGDRSEREEVAVVKPRTRKKPAPEVKSQTQDDAPAPANAISDDNVTETASSVE